MFGRTISMPRERAIHQSLGIHHKRGIPALLQLLTLASAMLIAGPALADRIVWKKTTLEESSQSWRIDIEIHLSKAPDIAHLPTQFKFEPEVYYERSMIDGSDQPQVRKVPLENKQPLIETVDIGFLDPGSGKIQNRTRFSFRLTRDRGFEAGEYKVTIRNKRTDRTIGTSQRLTLEGDNEVIDRRSMVFDSKKSDEKAKQKREDDNADAMKEYEERENPNSEEFWSGGPTEPEEKEQSLPPPAHMQEKPGACGCRIPGSPTAPSSGLAALLATLGLALVGRRRARA